MDRHNQAPADIPINADPTVGNTTYRLDRTGIRIVTANPSTSQTAPLAAVRHSASSGVVRSPAERDQAEQRAPRP